MATYDLTRTGLNHLLDTVGHVDPAIRSEIISTLEEVGVYTSPGSTADTVVINDATFANPRIIFIARSVRKTMSRMRPGKVPDGRGFHDNPNVIIYTDNVSGFVPSVPDDATAIVFASDDGVTASIDGSGVKIVVSGDGNDVLLMSGDSDDKVFSGGGNDIVWPVEIHKKKISIATTRSSAGAATICWMAEAATTCCSVTRAMTPCSAATATIR